MTTVFTKGKSGGDLVLSNIDPIIHVESREFTNSTGDDIVFPVGFPFTFDATVATAVVAATLANTEGILLQETRVSDGETVDLALLARGPVAVNKDVLPDEDLAAATLVEATFITALEGLGMVVRAEPTVQEQQTT